MPWPKLLLLHLFLQQGKKEGGRGEGFEDEEKQVKERNIRRESKINNPDRKSGKGWKEGVEQRTS